MPITMSGMASGLDTDAIIEKLVNVESRPIKQLEIRKKNHNIRKEGLKNLGKYLDELNSAARELFGFRASYTDKAATVSDPSILEAKATRDADKGLRKIKVIQVAESHRISSDPVEEKTILPAGKFTLQVDGASAVVNFKGGRLKDLKEKIDEAASSLVTTNYLRKTGDSYVLTIQSTRSGEKGEIKISGDKELLTGIGLVDGAAGEKKSGMSVTFDSRYFTSYMGERKPAGENGSVRVAEGGKSVTVSGLLWREYALPVEAQVKEDTRLEFELAYREKGDDDAGVPKRLNVGPQERVNIKGIILDGYNPERKREERADLSAAFDSVLGIGIVSSEGGSRVEKIYPIAKDARGPQTIAVGKDMKGGKIAKLVLYCNRGVMDVSSLRIATPVDQKGMLEPKNTVSRAQDAKLSVDGIELTRDRNDALTDVIRGVTLTVKRPSSGDIDLNVEHSIDTSVEKIRKFVDAYNKYLDFNADLTKSAKTQKPGEYDKMLQESGILSGDMTMMRLESSLRATVNAAYPNGAERPIKMLSQMGITTGAVNAAWEAIKSGKLVVDEGLLKSSIIDNPEGVMMFFGSDTDGDDKPDEGMAFKLTYVLKPYIMPGKNLIAVQIENEDNSIKMADDSIKRKEDHLKKYEEKLRAKFARMEQAISETNSKKQWMKQQMGGMSGGDDDKGK
jgi:flagellar hook-associated protein 2